METEMETSALLQKNGEISETGSPDPEETLPVLNQIPSTFSEEMSQEQTTEYQTTEALTTAETLVDNQIYQMQVLNRLDVLSYSGLFIVGLLFFLLFFSANRSRK